jgi:spore coat protein U-like protein
MRGLALAALFLLAGGAQPAAAATCSAYASSLVFGNYVSTTTVTTTGTVTVICPSGTAYEIGLNAGMGNGATVTTRTMTGGAGGQATLAYALFSNAAHTSNWGNTSGSGWVAGTGTGSAQSYNIYAQLPAGQYVAPGSFTDTITASITGNFATATAQFSVTATVQASCLISATSLNFGTYADSLINATSTLTVTCTKTTTFNIGLNAGAATGATVNNRSMTGPASALLGYELFSDAGRTLNWGVTVGINTVAGTGSGTAYPITVYGRIPAAESATPGTYSDTITATVTY